jgi:hypothetical protein
MGTCECCGNAYDKPIEVTVNGTAHVFDSFACAIHVLAPRCAHCTVPIIGHGVETDTAMFCCAHCARQAGVRELQDRV